MLVLPANRAANGAERAEVPAAAPVRLEGAITLPPQPGSIIEAGWDFDGDGTLDRAITVPAKTGGSLAVSARHAYERPGPYVAVLRGVSQREADRKTPFGRIANLARVRIVVK